MSKTVLFLCTGNYYRSRYAEILFNHRAAKLNLNWRAESRGLATEKGIFNVGPISANTLQRLKTAGIACPTTARPPAQVSEADLAGAGLIIALKESEHRQMLEERYPTWPDRVEYWHVHDLDLATADEALTEITGLVDDLIWKLSA
jgi:protein-tyrosine phosphatase